MADDRSSMRTRPSLLMRLRDLQDAEAWTLFVDTYAPLVYGYCRRQGLQEEDAADVSQEVMTQITRSMTTFEYQPERGRFRDWLGAVVRSKISRWRRKRSPGLEGRGTSNDGHDVEDFAVSTVDAAWTERFDSHLVRLGLERIRRDFETATWRAFELTWLEDQSAVEVANVLNIPVTTVYVAKSRVLKRLREEILILAEDVPHIVPLA